MINECGNIEMADRKADLKYNKKRCFPARSCQSDGYLIRLMEYAEWFLLVVTAVIFHINEKVVNLFIMIHLFCLTRLCCKYHIYYYKNSCFPKTFFSTMDSS